MKDQRQYCLDILRRIAQIERFTSEGEQAFMADDRTQEAVVRCFEVVGEAIKRLDTNLTAQHPDFPWRSYAGFRDVLIHQYDSIQLSKVWEAVRDDLIPLKQVITSILDKLSTDSQSDDTP
jgi:uncharacterized protein with HEPN domain